MIKKRNILVFLFMGLFPLALFPQSIVTVGETIYLEAGSFRGEIQWQESPDSISWSDIPGATYAPYSFPAIETKYYRAEVRETGCPIVYSDIKKIIVVSTLPVLTTKTVTNITEDAAQSGGDISFDGGMEVTAKGVAWGTSQMPTIANPHTNDGNGSESFSSQLTTLSAHTLYYIRAYATNENGTAYGNELTFTTLPAQPSAINGPTTACQGQSGLNYSVTEIAGITYNWTYSGSGITIVSGQGSAAINVSFSSSATSGTLSITPSNVSGNGTPQTISITVNPLPTSPSVTASPNPVCEGGTLILSGDANDATNWSWTGPNGYTSTAQSPQITNVTTSAAGEYSFTASNACGSTGTVYTASVQIATLPTGSSALASPNPVCEGGTLSLTGNANNATSWSWTGPNGFTSTAQNPIITSVTTAAAGVYYMTTGNACGYATTVSTNFIEVIPYPVATIAGAHLENEYAITWKWNVVNGVSGYKWNTTNDYATAVDMDTATSYIETDLICNTSYERFVWTYNNCGTSAAISLLATTLPVECPAFFTDERDGKQYAVVVIGCQCWMAENLAYLPEVHSNAEYEVQSNNEQSGYGVYGYDGNDVPTAKAQTNYAVYGVLYNWWAAMQGSASCNGTGAPPNDQCTQLIRGICPKGWHLPSHYEWTTLEQTVCTSGNCDEDFPYDYSNGWRGTNEGIKLKATSGWDSGGNGSNEYGFSSTPGGFRYNIGVFLGFNYGYEGEISYWWTASSTLSELAISRHLNYTQDNIAAGEEFKYNGFSVRCIKGCPVPEQPAASTHNAGVNKITWNWNPVPGIIGYKFNTVNDYSTATDMVGLGISYTESSLLCETDYQRYIWAYNDCGESDVTVLSANTLSCSIQNCGMITDIRDGNTYQTVIIGDQCWMAENLKYLPVVHSNAQFETQGNNEQPGYGVYGYDDSFLSNAFAEPNYSAYGVLYNWYAAMYGAASSISNPSGVRGICPEGWHLPSDAEWTQLTEHLSANPEYWCAGVSTWIAKSLAATSGWDIGTNSCNVGFDQTANNLTGFSALPGGSRFEDGNFAYSEVSAYFWSSTQSLPLSSFVRSIGYSISDVSRSSRNKPFGLSVRCVKDPSVQQRLDAGERPKQIYDSGIPLDSLYGKTYQGGLIFHLNTTTGDGLVAAPSDQSTGIQWGCSGYEVGGTTTANGLTNTSLIVAFHDSWSDFYNNPSLCDAENDGNVAAKFCDTLTLNGYSDWVLPSREEIVMMYHYLHHLGHSSFDSTSYWTSDEESSEMAWAQSFGTGGVAQPHWKAATANLRAIRAFFEPCIQPPVAPIEATHTVSQNQIVWRWTAVPGATGYKWNTANDFAFAVDMGTNTKCTETALNCGTAYERYVWAYNGCGEANPLILNETTLGLQNPCDGVTAPPGYGIVANSCQCWLDRNLGATQVATSSTDANAYGDLYQWGRATDGHQIRTSGTTATLSTGDNPGHDNFITTGSSPYDWRNPQNNNLWQGVSGINNPCPAGWRLPTETEWNTERLSWGTNNAAGAFGSPLKLPVAGHRGGSDGSLYGVDSSGHYWSSTVSSTSARALYFSSSDANMSSGNRAGGLSVRCLKD